MLNHDNLMYVLLVGVKSNVSIFQVTVDSEVKSRSFHVNTSSCVGSLCKDRMEAPFPSTFSSTKRQR